MRTGIAASRLSASHPTDHQAASLKLGSRPRAKKWRSSHRKKMRAAMSAAHGAMEPTSTTGTIE
jgi:hypothetical protein